MGFVPALNPALDRVGPAAESEAALVGELCAGAERAFTYLLAVYQHPVYNLIAHILGNETEAADVVQDVFVKVFRGVKHFHGKSTLKTWIYRIAVNQALNHRRSWRRRLSHEPISIDYAEKGSAPPIEGSDDGAGAPDRLLEQAETQVLVQKALASLAAPYRTMLVLRELEDLSYEEIAAVTGVAEGTVKSRLKRGRELLRRKLEGRLGAER